PELSPLCSDRSEFFPQPLQAVLITRIVFDYSLPATCRYVSFVISIQEVSTDLTYQVRPEDPALFEFLHQILLREVPAYHQGNLVKVVPFWLSQASRILDRSYPSRYGAASHVRRDHGRFFLRVLTESLYSLNLFGV